MTKYTKINKNKIQINQNHIRKIQTNITKLTILPQNHRIP
jgi:septum formation topological specificity factor MinE